MGTWETEVSLLTASRFQWFSGRTLTTTLSLWLIALTALQLSAWYNALSESEKMNVRAMVLHGVHFALFGVFAVIDGVRVIEDAEEKSLEAASLGRHRAAVSLRNESPRIAVLSERGRVRWNQLERWRMRAGL